MDEIKKIRYEKINVIVAEQGFDFDMALKDYYLTAILFMLQGIDGIYFKGGTALQKIFLDHARLSEDLDFTLTEPLDKIEREISAKLKASGLFQGITKGKSVEGFTRLIVHYKDFSNQEDSIFIDLNQRSKLLLKPEKHEINHFYKDTFPDFSFNTLAKDEMIAEKIAAAINRNKPRDHYDIYKIIEKKIPIRLGLAKEKCQQEGSEFSIIRMFNQAKKLKNRWDKDMAVLIRDKVTFQKVITTLAKHFKLKEEKDKLRKKK